MCLSGGKKCYFFEKFCVRTKGITPNSFHQFTTVKEGIPEWPYVDFIKHKNVFGTFSLITLLFFNFLFLNIIFLAYMRIYIIPKCNL